MTFKSKKFRFFNRITKKHFFKSKKLFSGCTIRFKCYFFNLASRFLHGKFSFTWFLFQMTRYKQAEFEDEDSSSIGSVALNSEGISTSATHIRYHTVRVFQY